MTVTFRVVADFDQLTIDQAKNVLYDELITACEEKGVYLSRYGNHTGLGTLDPIDNYNNGKADKNLFDIARIQKVFSFLPTMLENVSIYKTGSYHLKHVVERRQAEYLSNGDLIAAMLMRGYKARFAKRGEQLNVNCEFKVKVIE